MSSIHEYAQRAGISPRAVRFRIKEGTLAAHKTGGTWLITEDLAGATARRPGRRLSARSFDLLAAYLDGDDVDQSSDERRRAAERASRVLRLGVRQVREFAQRPEISVERFRASVEDLAELREDRRLVFTGVSHHDSEVYGPVIDAYVSRPDRDEIEMFHLLEPASRSDSNITLRVQDPPPEVRRLHVIADLLDDYSPRSLTEAERLFADVARWHR